MKERHCSHCFQCLFSQPCAGFFFSPFSPGPFALQVRWLFCVILRPVAVLALFGYPGHILVYAPGDILTSPPCHKPDDFTDELFGFDNVKIHSGITGKKRKA
ncbi:hypothetical protein [Morganella morganii]|uniref:hypothetical protein n=1 Tax=Morganella morganii TaxID=582 RepID=UPI001C7D4448|nr:hypothetical protein [Morganella morganii]